MVKKVIVLKKVQKASSKCYSSQILSKKHKHVLILCKSAKMNDIEDIQSVLEIGADHIGINIALYFISFLCFIL
jgi:imidazole glycerol phosphate synthase subunit HisF